MHTLTIIVLVALAPIAVAVLIAIFGVGLAALFYLGFAAWYWMVHPSARWAWDLLHPRRAAARKQAEADSRNLIMQTGFYMECLRRLGEGPDHKLFTSDFRALPPAAKAALIEAEALILARRIEEKEKK